MSIIFSNAEPRQAAALKEPGRHAATRLQSLMQVLSGKDVASMEFDNLRTLVESLPLSGNDCPLVANYLRKAQRYLRSNEEGAARYELRLLLEYLQSC